MRDRPAPARSLTPAIREDEPTSWSCRRHWPDPEARDRRPCPTAADAYHRSLRRKPGVGARDLSPVRDERLGRSRPCLSLHHEPMERWGLPRSAARSRDPLHRGPAREASGLTQPPLMDVGGVARAPPSPPGRPAAPGCVRAHAGSDLQRRSAAPPVRLPLRHADRPSRPGDPRGEPTQAGPSERAATWPDRRNCCLPVCCQST